MITHYNVMRISPEQYNESLRNGIRTDGLYKTVKNCCDEINNTCVCLSYYEHGLVQEQLCMILDLIKMAEGVAKNG